jgi:hypothetical protein
MILNNLTAPQQRSHIPQIRMSIRGILYINKSAAKLLALNDTKANNLSFEIDGDEIYMFWDKHGYVIAKNQDNYYIACSALQRAILSHLKTKKASLVIGEFHEGKYRLIPTA